MRFSTVLDGVIWVDHTTRPDKPIRFALWRKSDEFCPPSPLIRLNNRCHWLLLLLLVSNSLLVKVNWSAPPPFYLQKIVLPTFSGKIASTFFCFLFDHFIGARQAFNLFLFFLNCKINLFDWKTYHWAVVLFFDRTTIFIGCWPVVQVCHL